MLLCLFFEVAHLLRAVFLCKHDRVLVETVAFFSVVNAVRVAQVFSHEVLLQALFYFLVHLVGCLWADFNSETFQQVKIFC